MKYNLAYDSESSSLSYDGSTSDTSYRGSMAANFVSLKPRQKKCEPEVFTFDTTSVDDTSSCNQDDITSEDPITMGGTTDYTASTCSESFDTKICKIFGVEDMCGSDIDKLYDVGSRRFNNFLNQDRWDDSFIAGEHGFNDAVFGESGNFEKHRQILHESAQHVIEAVNRLSHHLSSQATTPTSAKSPLSIGSPLKNAIEQISEATSRCEDVIMHRQNSSSLEYNNKTDQTWDNTKESESESVNNNPKFTFLMNKIAEKYNSNPNIEKPPSSVSVAESRLFDDNLQSRAQSVPKQIHQLTGIPRSLRTVDVSSDSEVETPVRRRPRPRPKTTHDATTNKFPIVNRCSVQSSVSDVTTMDDVINDVSPELTLKRIQVQELTARNLKRLSDYDNMNGEDLSHIPQTTTPARTAISSVGTFYCSPWDSNLWDDIFGLGHTAHQPKPPVMPSVASPVSVDAEADYCNLTPVINDYSNGRLQDEPACSTNENTSEAHITSLNIVQESSSSQTHQYSSNNAQPELLSVPSFTEPVTPPHKIDSSSCTEPITPTTPLSLPSRGSCVSGISMLSNFSLQNTGQLDEAEDDEDYDDDNTTGGEVPDLVMARPKSKRSALCK